MRTKSGTTSHWSYDMYFELLHDAALHHDKVLKTTSKKRQTHIHTIEPVEPDYSHDVETPHVNTNEIFMTTSNICSQRACEDISS